jgi:hypothetical protein
MPAQMQTLSLIRVAFEPFLALRRMVVLPFEWSKQINVFSLVRHNLSNSLLWAKVLVGLDLCHPFSLIEHLVAVLDKIRVIDAQPIIKKVHLAPVGILSLFHVKSALRDEGAKAPIAKHVSRPCGLSARFQLIIRTSSSSDLPELVSRRPME